MRHHSNNLSIAGAQAGGGGSQVLFSLDPTAYSSGNIWSYPPTEYHKEFPGWLAFDANNCVYVGGSHIELISGGYGAYLLHNMGNFENVRISGRGWFEVNDRIILSYNSANGGAQNVIMFTGAGSMIMGQIVGTSISSPYTSIAVGVSAQVLFDFSIEKQGNVWTPTINGTTFGSIVHTPAYSGGLWGWHVYRNVRQRFYSVPLLIEQI